MSAFANQQGCSAEVDGYKVLKNSVYAFRIDSEKACFFAFYTVNPDPGVDAKGVGNTGDAIWYAYYKLNNPDKIYRFPKPSDTYWSNVCTINAVSFYDMNNDKKRDVTVIGACDKNAINHNYVFVFIRKGDKYVLNEDVYDSLFGIIALTVEDVRAYIKNPEKNYTYLRDRYNPD